MKKKFRILSLIIMCCATISLSLGAFSLVKHFSRPSDAAGETSSNPVKIYSASDFVNFVNDATPSAGVGVKRYGKIMNDIDSVNVREINSINMYQEQYGFPNIVLEGNNKRVSYWCSIYNQPMMDIAIGLFGWVDSIKVSNLIVDGSVFLEIDSDNGVTGVGGLIGGVSRYAEIINCHVTATIEYLDYSSYSPSPFVGGFVGSASGWLWSDPAAEIIIKNSTSFGFATLEGRVSGSNFSGYAGKGMTIEDSQITAYNSYYNFMVNGGLRKVNPNSSGFSSAYTNYDSSSNISLNNKFVNGAWADYYEAGYGNDDRSDNEKYDPYDVYGSNPNIYWLVERDKVSPYSLTYKCLDPDGNEIEGSVGDIGYVVDTSDCWNYTNYSKKLTSKNFGVEDEKRTISVIPNNYELDTGTVTTNESEKTAVLTLRFKLKPVPYCYLNFESTSMNNKTYNPSCSTFETGTTKIKVLENTTCDEIVTHSASDTTITYKFTLNGSTVHTVTYTVDRVYTINTSAIYYGDIYGDEGGDSWYFVWEVAGYIGTHITSGTLLNITGPTLKLKQYNTEFN